MIDKSLQKKLLQKILSSKEFAGSKIYESYLTYLVEATANGKAIKETTIAIEVFGKDASFNPAEDTIVRSHTYHLRKKLESYYYNEGKDDKYRLEIPKGHYEAVFTSASDNHISSRNRLLALPRNKFLVVTILLLFTLLAFLWIRNRTLETQLQEYQFIDKSDPIWGDYLASELPVLITIGDHFFFSENDDRYEQELAIRHGKVNSLEDLQAFRAKYPDKKLEPADEPYFPYHSIWSLPPILALFNSVRQTPVIRKSSSLSPQMLDEYNMIFLGSIKTLYILKHTLSKSHFDFTISPHKVIYSPPDSTSPQVFETSLHSPGQNDDLVIALKLPGPVQNSIFIIASFHSLGAPEVAKFLTQESTRKQLENRFRSDFNKVPQYFELLFRVTGIDKTAYNTEILVCNEIRAE